MPQQRLLGDALAQAPGIADMVDAEVYADGGDVDITYCGAAIDVKTVGRHRSDRGGLNQVQLRRRHLDVGQPW